MERDMEPEELVHTDSYKWHGDWFISGSNLDFPALVCACVLERASTISQHLWGSVPGSLHCMSTYLVCEMNDSTSEYYYLFIH